MNMERSYKWDRLLKARSLSWAHAWPMIHWSGPQGILLLTLAVLLVATSLCWALIPTPLVTIVIFIVIIIVTVALLHPQLALLLIFLCASFPALVLPLPGHNMHLIEPASVLCLLVTIIRHPPGRLSLSHLLAACFLAIAVLSFIHVPDLSSGVNEYAPDKRLLALIMVFIAFFNGTLLAWYVRKASAFLSIVLLVNIPLYLVGLAQSIGWHLSPFLEQPGAYNPQMTQGRLWGPFPWSVNFAMYLSNLFAISLACWLCGTRRRERMLGGLMTVVTTLEIIGSGTRSVALAALVILISACIITRHVRLLLITGIVALIPAGIYFNKVLPLFLHDETSTDNRLLIWNEAIKLALANPWIGIGLQQFHLYYAQLIVNKNTELGPQGIHPHQQYLEWAMEGGFPWLLIGILLLFTILYTCWHAYKTNKREQQLIPLAALLALMANSIVGFFDAPLDQLEGPVCLFLLAGLAAGSIMRHHYSAAGGVGGRHSSAGGVGGRHSSAGGAGGRQSHGRGVGCPHNIPFFLGPPAAAQEGYLNNYHRTNNKPAMQKTGRSIIIQLLAWGIAIPIIFPLTALLTRYLGPIQYGEYSLTFPFLTFFAQLSGTGMDPLIIRQLSCQPRKAWSSILSYATGSRLLATFLSSSAATLIACILPIHAEQRNLLLLGSISLFFSFSFNGVRIVYAHGFQAEQKVGLLSLLETCNRILTAGLVLLVVYWHLSLLWAYVLLVYSDLPAFILQVFLASKRFGIRPRFSHIHFRKHMLEGLPLLGHKLLTLLSGQFDLVVLLWITGPENVGIYALASRTIDPLASIALAYVNGLYPLFCTKFQSGRQHFAEAYYESMRAIALIIIPLAIFVGIAASTIVSLLGGKTFMAATTAVQFLMWAMVASFFNQVGEQACVAARLEKRIPFVTSISAGINLLSNLLLIPHWQIVGAGISAVLSEYVGMLIFMLLLKPHVRLLSTLLLLLRIFASNIPTLVFLLWQQHLSLLLKLPIAVVITLVFYAITRTCSLHDIRMVKHIVYGLRAQKITADKEADAVALEVQQKLSIYPTLTLPRIHV